MALEDDLRTFVLADSGVQTYIASGSGRMFYNHVPMLPLEQQELDLILYYQTGGDSERCLDDAAGLDPFRMLFAIECMSRDIDRAKALYRAAWRRLNNKGGSLGSGLSTVQGIFCEQPDDAFVARGMDDLGWENCAFIAEVIP